MSTRKEPSLHTTKEASGVEPSPAGSRPPSEIPPPDGARGTLISVWSELFSHRRHSRGMFLPLVRMDRID